MGIPTGIGHAISQPLAPGGRTVYLGPMSGPLPILYEDDEILVVDKPSGVPSIPERYESGALSVLDILKREHSGIQAVHRIDKETSGILLLCKTDDAFRSLSGQFSDRLLEKTYLVLVMGRPSWTEFAADAPLLADGDRRHRTVVSAKGKPSLTRFRLLEGFRSCSLLEASPETGRTHQIRVHLANEGFPVVCDPLYGSGEPLFLSSFKRGYKAGGDKERPLLGRLGLHAAAIRFRHPGNGLEMEIEAPLPKDFRTALTQLRKNS